jgi:hypothetical protein
MTGELAYSYKGSALGAPWEFELKSDGIVWRVGSRSGLIRYGQVNRVRLSFRPMTMQNYRFLTEIWSEEMPRIRIASTTWRGLVEQTRQDEAYTAFVVELHRRLAAAGTRARFFTGIPGVNYWIGIAIFAGIALGLAALTVHALRLGEWTGAAFIGGFFALVIWQLGGFFRRNRPGLYRPEEVPAIVLPRR